MKNTPVGGFKNRNVLTVIEITVVETYIMAKNGYRSNILVLNSNNYAIWPPIKRCIFSYLMSDLIIAPAGFWPRRPKPEEAS